jgi:hypothetical protein
MAIQTRAGQHSEYESVGIRLNNMPAVVDRTIRPKQFGNWTTLEQCDVDQSFISSTEDVITKI